MTGICQFETWVRDRSHYTLTYKNVILDAIRAFKAQAPRNLPKGPPTSRRITDSVKSEVIAMWNETGMSQIEIATELGLHQSRVNEIIKGKR